MSVLIISRDWAIQNVVSQLVITCGYPSIMTETMQEAEAKLVQPRSATWALIVIDAEVFDETGAGLSRGALQRLQTWSAPRPGPPVVYLGDVLQKYALLAARPALVPFVTLPVSPHVLMQTLQPLLPNGGELLSISYR
jgi:CheY-like chemotaxis protein